MTKETVTYKTEKYNNRDRQIDKILTSKTFGIPIMIIFLGIILWLTIVGANYPSGWLTSLFEWLQVKIVYA